MAIAHEFAGHKLRLVAAVSDETMYLLTVKSKLLRYNLRTRSIDDEDDVSALVVNDSKMLLAANPMTQPFAGVFCFKTIFLFK